MTDRTDKLAGNAPITNGLRQSRPDLNFVAELETVPSPGPKPRASPHRSPGGGRRRERKHLKGRERAVVNQTNTGTVSKPPTEKPLTDRAERIWAFRRA